MIHALNQQCIPHYQQVCPLRYWIVICNHHISNLNHLHRREILVKWSDVCKTSTSGYDCAVTAGNCHVGMGVQFSCLMTTVVIHRRATYCRGTHRGADRAVSNRRIILIRQWPPLMRTAGPSALFPIVL